MDSLSPDALADRIERGDRVTLLDVRDRTDIDAWRIDGPGVDRLEVPSVKFVAAGVSGDPADLLPDDVPEPVVAVCGRGEASAAVADLLTDAGVEAVNLAGGMRGWARVYRATDLDVVGGATPGAGSDGATVVQYRRPSSGCLAYLVVAGDAALVVDPLRAFSDRYARDARAYGADLVAAVDTHVHADHLSGLRDVMADGVRGYMSRGAVERGVAFDVETLADGDTLRLDDATVEVVATPGHTTGMVSLHVGDVLLCGDTLFVDGVARPDLQRAPLRGADGASGEAGDPRDEEDEAAAEYARELYRTLTERLARFDDDTVVAPGHYGDGAARAADGSYTARLGDLRERLWPFGVDADTFVTRLLDGMGPPPANFERIVAVNLGREAADDETAFELELGPNNCAAAAD